MNVNRYTPMTEYDVTRVAVQSIFKDFLGDQPAVAPTFEIADEKGLRPDQIIAALDDDLDIKEMDEIEPDDLLIHTVESKVDRRYLVKPDFSGVTQASNYWGNYNWLAVAEDADLEDDKWNELAKACKRERIGLIVCSLPEGRIELEPGYDDTEQFTHYPRWNEVYNEFCRQFGFDQDG